MIAEMRNRWRGEVSKEYEKVSDDGCVRTNPLFLHLGQPHDYRRFAHFGCKLLKILRRDPRKIKPNQSKNPWNY
jgi:hypothetical protein